MAGWGTGCCCSHFLLFLPCVFFHAKIRLKMDRNVDEVGSPRAYCFPWIFLPWDFVSFFYIEMNANWGDEVSQTVPLPRGIYFINCNGFIRGTRQLRNYVKNSVDIVSSLTLILREFVTKSGCGTSDIKIKYLCM